MDAERARILGRLRAIKRDIEIEFNTAEHWNASVRKPDEQPLDPDPFGELKALAAAIDELLTNDPGVGPIAELKYQRHH